MHWTAPELTVQVLQLAEVQSYLHVPVEVSKWYMALQVKQSSMFGVITVFNVHAVQKRIVHIVETHTPLELR